VVTRSPFRLSGTCERQCPMWNVPVQSPLWTRERRRCQPGSSGILLTWQEPVALHAGRSHIPMCPGDGRQRSAWLRASPFLSHEVLQGRVARHGVVQEPLQPSVLVLQHLQPLGLRDLQRRNKHSFVDAGVADPVFSAQICHRNACLVLLQDPGGRLFRKAAALMLWSTSWQHPISLRISPVRQGQTAPATDF
jgi:hypothetical protein